MSTRRLSLFISNLPWTIGDRELKKYFSQYGRVHRQNVIFSKRTGFSRGFGFVTFESREALDNVLMKQKHVLEGNLLRIQERTTDDPRD